MSMSSNLQDTKAILFAGFQLGTADYGKVLLSP